MNAIDTLISALEGSPEVRPGTARAIFGAALNEIVYPQPDIDRLNLLRDAVGVCGLEIAWKTADVMRCFRDVGVPMTKASARSLLARLTAEGVLARIDEPGRRHYVVAEAQPEIVHGCPPSGSGLTTCCHRPPFELPHTDRLTVEPDAITCTAPQPELSDTARQLLTFGLTMVTDQMASWGDEFDADERRAMAELRRLASPASQAAPEAGDR